MASLLVASKEAMPIQHNFMHMQECMVLFWLRGCLHDTRGTFLLGRVRPFFLPWFCISSMTLPEYVISEKVIPVQVHPGCCIRVKVSS